MRLITEALLAEDEESLLPQSPSSIISTSTETITTSIVTWRRLPKVMFGVGYHALLFVVPSFLRGRVAVIPNNSEKIPQPSPNAPKGYSTEYLDGVRGLASLVVFVLHWTHVQYPGVNSGYIADGKHSLWQLPIVRVLYSGAAMVSIFFVVSGYVLTHRFIQKMHRCEYDGLFSGLSSLTFRRVIRLFLPAFGSCILAYICASLRLISIPKKVGNKAFHHGWRALISYLDLESNPWTWDLYMKGFYNPQLWSIAVEYRGSMAVFLTVLGLARCRTSIRMTVEAGIVAHAFGHKRWDVALFVAGMLIAEWDVFVSISKSRSTVMKKSYIKATLYSIMFLGVWMSGYSRDHGSDSFGYTFTKGLWPYGDYRRRFWLSIGSILIVGPMPYLPLVQLFFCTRPIRYLGRISFALYLIHGLGNRTIGTAILHLTWRILGKEGYWRYALAYVVSSLLYTPIIICLADVYWRAADIPATRFAKWFEAKCAAKISI